MGFWWRRTWSRDNSGPGWVLGCSVMPRKRPRLVGAPPSGLVGFSLFLRLPVWCDPYTQGRTVLRWPVSISVWSDYRDWKSLA